MRAHEVLLAFLLLTPLAAWAAPAPPLQRLADVRPGQRAVVHTVLEGARVDTFSATIVGVMRTGKAEGSVIVARATNERVSHTGIAQGMSGSPVYVDGKLAGALSSGWSFVKDPLFGITPIEEMLPVLDLPEPRPGSPTAGPTGLDRSGERASLPGGADGTFGEFRWNDTALEAQAPPAPPSVGLRPLVVPLACVGLDPEVMEAARPSLAGLGFNPVAAGSAVGESPGAGDLQPGSAFAVDLMRGDLRLAAIGTITYRDGDRFLGFGHPFFQAGDVHLPVSTAEIVTIIPSELTSFKLGMPGRPIGALYQDRRTAVAGRVGAMPRLVPLSVRVSGPGAAPALFRYELVEDPQLAPQLAAIGAVSAFMESGGSGAGQTVRWKLRVAARGLPPLELHDLATGGGLSGDLMAQLRAPLDFLCGNPYRRLPLDSLSITLDTEPVQSAWVLRNARLSRPRVRPGGEVTLHLEIERLRGESEERDITLRVPPEMGEGEVVVWVGGATELMRFEAQRRPGRYRPTSLEDAWGRLASVRTRDGLYATLWVRAADLTADGVDLPELPGSAQAVLLSPQMRGEQALPGRGTLLGEWRQPVAGVLRGELQLSLEVDEDAP